MSEDRSTFIGSSDIAAILGISPWKTAYEVWLEKTPRDLDEIIDTDHAKRLRRGQRMEPVIIEMLQEERDVWVVGRNTREFHPEFSFLACQIDYTYFPVDTISCVTAKELFNGEVKSVDPRAAHEWGEDGSQDVPAHYAAQVMYGLAVTGRQEATISALIGDDLRCYVFKRDDELCQALIDKAVAFWNGYVLAKEPPPPQTKQDAAAIVRRFQGFSFEATEEVIEEAYNLRKAKAEIRKWTQEAEAAELALLTKVVTAAEVLGDGTAPEKISVLVDGRPLLTWNLQKRGGYEVKPSEFRVLRLKGEK